MSDIDTAAADSLKVLDPERPIREADIKPRGNAPDDLLKLPLGLVTVADAHTPLISNSSLQPFGSLLSIQLHSGLYADCRKRANCSLRSTAGLRKVLTRAI